jgi:hypothetical protein
MQNFFGKPEGKRTIRRSMSIWENNIMWDLQEIPCENANWTRLDSSAAGWVPVANSCENGSESSVSIKGGEFD